MFVMLILTHFWGLSKVVTISQETFHDDDVKWEHFPRYWPFVWGSHRSPVNSPHKSQWRGALIFSLIWPQINGWISNRDPGDLRRHRAHHDVTVMFKYIFVTFFSFSLYTYRGVLLGVQLLITRSILNKVMSCQPLSELIIWRISHSLTHVYTSNDKTLRWCHNGRVGVSNHLPHDCLLNCSFRRRSKKTSKLRVTGLCVRGIHRWPVNSLHKWPVTRKMFPFDDVIM